MSEIDQFGDPADIYHDDPVDTETKEDRIQSLGTIATETGIPVTELRRLLRAGIISGDKIGSIWITTVAVVKAYQAEARTPEEGDDG